MYVTGSMISKFNLLIP